MGSTLVRMICAASDFTLAGAVERADSDAVGRDAGALTGAGGPLGVTVRSELAEALEASGAELVIDFTSATASLAHARLCAARGVPLVIGSTGFSAEERAEVAALAAHIPIVLSPNMSVGVNVVLKLAVELARALGDAYDVEVLEAHHRMKKDAPSGTALRLAEDIARALGRETSSLCLARQGQVGARPPGEIGVQSLRGGDVVGEHTVFFFGEGERVELSHRATSRDQFARGALRAGRWVVGRPSGLYDMQDVLGLKGKAPGEEPR